MKRILTIIALLALSACGDDAITEIARYPSPVGGLEAVVGRITAGQSEPYMVVVTKPGEKPGKGARLLLADRSDAPVVEWHDADHLTIHCDGARVWSYRNFWATPSGSATVAVALDCGAKGWRP